MKTNNLKGFVAKSLIVVMTVTAIFVPGIVNADETGAAEKKVSAVPGASNIVLPSKIVSGTTFSVTVKGDIDPTISGTSDTDTKYIAKSFRIQRGVYDAKSQSLSGSASQTVSNIKLGNTNNYKLSVVYRTMTFNGSSWSAGSDYTYSTSLNVYGKITFNPNKGKFKSGSIKSKTVAYGSSYGALAKLKKRKGYKFMGWYSDSNKKTSSSKFTQIVNIELKAQWKYKIKLNANKGKIGKKKVKTKKVTSGQSYGTLPTPKRAKYVFLGWYTKKKGGDMVTDYTRVSNASKHTLYARWIKKSTLKKYPGYVTKAKYGAIQVGMTFNQVKAIIGGSPTMDMTVYLGSSPYMRTTKWKVKNKSSEVTIVFSPGGGDTSKVRRKYNDFGW